MADLTDNLIKELLQEYPELGHDEERLRAALRDMQANKPEVEADPAFKAALRQRLLASSAAPRRISFAWAALYAVPVGVTAVLMLVLWPTLQTSYQPNMFEVTPDAPSVEMGAFKAAEESAMDDMVTPMQMDARMMALPSVPYFEVAATRAGELQFYFDAQPLDSYIVVKDEVDNVVAVSPLILGGAVEVDNMMMLSPLDSTRYYNVYLYRDNGNGIYDAVDEVVLDEYGYPALGSIRFE
jgi:hypothetical protein